MTRTVLIDDASPHYRALAEAVQRLDTGAEVVAMPRLEATIPVAVLEAPEPIQPDLPRERRRSKRGQRRAHGGQAWKR